MSKFTKIFDKIDARVNRRVPFWRAENNSFYSKIYLPNDAPLRINHNAPLGQKELEVACQMMHIAREDARGACHELAKALQYGVNGLHPNTVELLENYYDLDKSDITRDHIKRMYNYYYQQDQKLTYGTLDWDPKLAHYDSTTAARIVSAGAGMAAVPGVTKENARALANFSGSLRTSWLTEQARAHDAWRAGQVARRQEGLNNRRNEYELGLIKSEALRLRKNWSGMSRDERMAARARLAEGIHRIYSPTRQQVTPEVVENMQAKFFNLSKKASTLSAGELRKAAESLVDEVVGVSKPPTKTGRPSDERSDDGYESDEEGGSGASRGRARRRASYETSDDGYEAGGEEGSQASRGRARRSAASSATAVDSDSEWESETPRRRRSVESRGGSGGPRGVEERKRGRGRAG